MAVHARRQVTRTFSESNIIQFPGGRTEDRGWEAGSLETKRRRQTGRDLPSDVQGRAIALSFAAYRTNPLAHRLIELQVNFVLGHGLTLNSESADFMSWLLEFWTNSYNAWPKKSPSRLRDYYIYGEWLHSPMYNRKAGMTYIGDIQPDAIRRIYPDVYSVSEADKIVLASVGENGTTVDYTYDLIRRRLTPGTWDLDRPSGQLHHFAMGKTSDSMRGVGVLFPILDVVDAYDDILFSRAEKIRAAGKIY